LAATESWLAVNRDWGIFAFIVISTVAMTVVIPEDFALCLRLTLCNSGFLYCQRLSVWPSTTLARRTPETQGSRGGG
jgi:hypothetical protein